MRNGTLTTHGLKLWESDTIALYWHTTAGYTLVCGNIAHHLTHEEAYNLRVGIEWGMSMNDAQA